MTQRYVIGVDGSRPAAAALRWAIARARRDPAPFVLVHVDEDGDGSAGAEIEPLTASALTTVLDALPDVPVSVVLLTGRPAGALAGYVGADDLLVIGTGKTGFLHGRVLGSRSVQIALAVPCSVAVIPDVDLRFRRGVVAGVERGETGAIIGRAAAREAWARGEDLLLIQAVDRRVLDRVGPQRAGLAVAAAMAAARAECPDLELRTRLSSRTPAEALLDTSRDRALLVLGPGSNDHPDSPLGTVLHEVLLNVNAPVLVSRPADHRQLVGPVGEQAAESVRRASEAG